MVNQRDHVSLMVVNFYIRYSLIINYMFMEIDKILSTKIHLEV